MTGWKYLAIADGVLASGYTFVSAMHFSQGKTTLGFLNAAIAFTWGLLGVINWRFSA